MEQGYSDELIQSHKKYLKALIAYDRPMEEIDKMERIGWEFDEVNLATLLRQDIINVLNRFLNGEFTTAQIINWGESLDCRPTIEQEPPYDQMISNVIGILANCIDEKDDPLTPQRVQDLIAQLQFAEPDR